MPALFVREIVRFVHHDEIGPQFAPFAQSVEELIAIDLRCPDDDGRVRALLAVACEYADVLSAEGFGKFLILLVRQRLQRTRVPDAAMGGEQPPDLFARDLSLAAARRRGHKHVFVFDCGEGFELKRIRFERRGRRRADAFEQPPHRA